MNPFRYTARESDSETGLYYYRARYYDPNAGRFTSEDPLGFNARQGNFYPYVSNSPLNFADPTGLKPFNRLNNFMRCLDGCLDTMIKSNFCTLKKKLKKLAIAAPAIGVGTCGLVVASEPQTAPAFVPCAALVTGSTAVIGGTMSIGSLNIENLSSGVGCPTFCAMNELR